jgi:hypothetical protein
MAALRRRRYAERGASDKHAASRARVTHRDARRALTRSGAADHTGHGGVLNWQQSSGHVVRSPVSQRPLPQVAGAQSRGHDVAVSPLSHTPLPQTCVGGGGGGELGQSDAQVWWVSPLSQMSLPQLAQLHRFDVGSPSAGASAARLSCNRGHGGHTAVVGGATAALSGSSVEDAAADDSSNAGGGSVVHPEVMPYTPATQAITITTP